MRKCIFHSLSVLKQVDQFRKAIRDGIDTDNQI